MSLTDEERGQLISLWLLAADRDGEIPNSPDLIQKLCYLGKKPNINKFIELELICPNGVTAASAWRQSDRPDKTRLEKDKEKDKDIYGEFKNVKLSSQEYEKLIDQFGEKATSEKIESLSSYVASKGKKYSSHYATILTWERKNKQPEVKNGYALLREKYGDA